MQALRPSPYVADWLDVGAPLLPPGDAARERLAEAYWNAIRRSLRGAVRPVGPALGPIALRIGPGGPALLAFDAAEPVADGLRFPIVGGVAAARPGGALELHVEARRVGVVVAGYAPRLGEASVALLLLGAPWTLGQRLAHVLVTRAALPRLAEAAGRADGGAA